jgi:hypothetical protein
MNAKVEQRILRAYASSTNLLHLDIDKRRKSNPTLMAAIL